MFHLPSRLLALVGFAVSAVAQCGLVWQPGKPVPATDGRVTSLTVLPQGDLVAAGWFTVAGSVRADRIARWDGSAWHPLGAGFDDAVNAVVTMPNGDIVAGGVFASAGGNAIANIARWNGSSWAPLGAGLNAPVTALCVAPNGDLLAGGWFTGSGGQALHRVARFDGTTWTQVGTGIDDGVVLAIAVLTNGDVAVGGAFQTAGGVPVASAARWHGATWQTLGLAGGSYVYALRTLANGQLVCGGRFGPSFNQNLAVFDATGLTMLPNPITGDVNALGLDAAGDLVVGGGAAGGNATGVNVARRHAGTWSPLASSNYTTFALALRNGLLVAGAGPTMSGALIAPTVREFDGASWTALGGATALVAGFVRAGRQDELFLGGPFTSIDGVAANNVARRAGGSWAPLGLGLDGPPTAAAVTPGGDLIVGGNFALAGGAPANRVARWNGVSWSTLGAGLPIAPSALAAGAGGRIVAAAGGSVHTFDLGVWTSLPQPAAGSAFDVGVLPDGDVVTVGTYVPRVWRWDGSTWSPLPAPPIGSNALTVAENGDVCLVPSFGQPVPSNRVARWDGAAWQLLGVDPFSGTVRRLTSLPNGDLLALGTFAAVGATQVGNIARWNGTSWQPVDGGVALGFGASTSVTDATMTTSGELFAIGQFEIAGSHVSSRLARAVPTCPATAMPFGAGCTGSAGPLSLAPQTLPWVGTTFRAAATGFAPASLGLHVLGLTPTVSPLPGGAPGCSLFTSPDLLELLLPTGGAVEVALAVPAEPTLVGIAVRDQVVGIELDASLAILRITSSNAIQLTVGAF